jgi:3-hydroxyacyl-CoA dehydrogenase
LGRPKSATFRTLDLAGLDVVGHVTRDLFERLPDDAFRHAFAPSPIIERLVERGWIGEKAGAGFYKRVGSEILTLDPATLTYGSRRSVRLPAIERANSIEDVRERVRVLFGGDDAVGTFLRETLAPLLVYSAEIATQVAYSIDDVDRAMHWGFGWELGPFELWDTIGVREVLAAARAANTPPLVQAVLDAGRNTFRDGPLPQPDSNLQILKAAKDRSKVIRRNAGASLVDLGDGVLAIDFHSKMNTIGGDTIQMVQAGLIEAAANFSAVVVGTTAQDFSAGANLVLILLEAQEGNWDEIDLMVRTFQQTTAALKYADVPVVVAPAGLALGGGCEILLHGDRVQAAAETYTGLVETSVGLIPAGGGTKEMLVRAMHAAGTGAHPLGPAQQVFETIAFAKVSTSAAHAGQLGYLRDRDAITMNRDRLIADAKAAALSRASAGYGRQAPPEVRVGGESVEATLKLGVHLAWRAGRISDHDALIGRTLAHIVAGGSLPHAAVVSEAHLLDLEREAFLKLCGERKTLDRIQHTLKTGKPLRN